MRRVAGFAMSIASIFLAVVSVLIQAPSLFYMATALFALIGGCNLQAWLAVRGLRFRRLAPGSARIGDLVTVEIEVWSEHKIRRPLITFRDKLPEKMRLSYVSSSLPIAPAYDFPIETMYQFRAQRRGRFRWSGLTVMASDPLGLVVKRKDYRTEPTELTVVPRPIPVSIDMPMAAGWGISEAESGQTRGAGIEPRGIREYSQGDSLRHVHWRSSARAGRLLVKEFEAGTHASAVFILQQTAGSDVGKGEVSSLDLMCGHALYLCEVFLRQGARVDFPDLSEGGNAYTPSERIAAVSEAMAEIDDDKSETVSEVLDAVTGRLPVGSIVFVLLSVADAGLPGAIGAAASHGTTVVPLLYAADQLGKLGQNTKSATDPEFIGSLRAAGSTPIVMPLEARYEE